MKFACSVKLQKVTSGQSERSQKEISIISQGSVIFEENGRRIKDSASDAWRQIINNYELFDKLICIQALCVTTP